MSAAADGIRMAELVVEHPTPTPMLHFCSVCELRERRSFLAPVLSLLITSFEVVLFELTSNGNNLISLSSAACS